MRQRVYEGYFPVDLVSFGKGQHQIVITSDSVAVLFYEPEKQKVLLVRQARPAMISDDNPQGLMTELVAGRFDIKLSVKALIAKEAFEEAGIVIEEEDILLLNDGKPMALSSGVITEKSYLAFAILPAGSYEPEERQFGLAQEDEVIERLWLDLPDFRHLPCDDLRVWALREWFFATFIK